MPAGKYNFAPKDGNFKGVRTFGEQVKHTATMIYMTAAIVLHSSFRRVCSSGTGAAAGCAA